MQRASFALRPRPPYDFDLTSRYMTFFRGRYGSDIYEGGTYRRLLDLNGSLILATVRSTGTLESPSLEVALEGRGPPDRLVAEARRRLSLMLGVRDDLSPFYRMAGGDPHLAPLVEGLKGLHLPQSASVCEALVLAILGQHISTHVARMLRTLLIQTHGPRLTLNGIDYFAFPRPDTLVEVGVDGLRAIKFSGRKAEYVVGIASSIAQGEFDPKELRGHPVDEAVEALTRLRGVGPWTAQWLLIRALGQSDGFPSGDLALQRTMGVLVNEGVPMTAQDALEYSRRWSPHRSYVTTYLFAAARSGRLTDLTGTGKESAESFALQESSGF